TLNQIGGKTSSGKEVEFVCYAYPDLPKEKFCLAIYGLGEESAKECQRNYSDGLRAALDERCRTMTLCRFAGCLVCCLAEPIDVDGQRSGYYRLRALKFADRNVVPFSDFEGEIVNENPHADLGILREEYDAIQVIDPALFSSYCDTLAKIIGILTKEEKQQTERSQEGHEDVVEEDDIIDVSSGTLRTVKINMADFKNSRLPVIIEGESGTGKEVIAKNIHKFSERGNQPFIVLSCASVPASLVEAELFGYRKGAFTGAHSDFPGFFERANRGTIFLDEVSAFSREVQAMLLRVIESGEFRPIGSEETIKVDARVMIATTRNLSELVEQGKFLKDLYYRINGIHIPVSPVRDHPEDVMIYAQAFLDRINANNDSDKVFTNEADKLLTRYQWPGNIRQIKNVVRQAALLAARLIGPRHLPEEVMQPKKKEESSTSKTDFSMKALEKRHISEVMDRCEGNISEAAKLLGMSRTTLYKKLKTLGLEE
ncbi:sigma 54-interacting transcriptional regulator, partial [Planctomycetota bacterium]